MNISFQGSLTAASRSLYTATEGQVYFDKISIEVPSTWSEIDCRIPLSSSCLPPTGSRVGVILYCGILHPSPYRIKGRCKSFIVESHSLPPAVLLQDQG